MQEYEKAEERTEKMKKVLYFIAKISQNVPYFYFALFYFRLSPQVLLIQ